MRNNFLSTSLNSVVSLDMDSSWAARSWDFTSTYWNPNTYQVPYRKANSREILLTEQDPVWPTNLSQGKVRQLFQERRGGKGWDKSHPLEPLKNKKNNNNISERIPETKSLSNLSDNSIALSQTLPDKAYFYKKLPNIGGIMQSKSNEPSSAPAKKRISRIPQPNNSERLKSPTVTVIKDIRKLTISPRKTLGDEISIKPKSTEIKRFSPLTKKEEERPRLQKTATEHKSSSSDTPLSMKVRTPVSSPPKPERPNTNSTPEKAKPQPPVHSSNPDFPQCSICGRSFAADRLEVHEKICKKSKTKKRKVFDPTKQRLAGTEAESYLKKAPSQKQPIQQSTASKSNWRKKHEEFIANIRAAKEVKAHLAKGGKLSDLPPPPPLDTSDYTQCPHCNRKFNQTAAERHIPICANMKHNKPKKINKK